MPQQSTADLAWHTYLGASLHALLCGHDKHATTEYC
jgi:hypothetical protein